MCSFQCSDQKENSHQLRFGNILLCLVVKECIYKYNSIENRAEIPEWVVKLSCNSSD